MNPLNRISPAWRLSIVLSLATLSVILLAAAAGLLPDGDEANTEARLRLAEAVGLQVALAAPQGDDDSFAAVAETILARTGELRSLGLRTPEGELIFGTTGHDELWDDRPWRPRVPTHVELPLSTDDQEWATAELRFASAKDGFLSARTQLCIFVALACLVGFRLYLRHVLRYLDPSSVIPTRVKTMLDTMAEGVVVLDDEERVVLANEKFLQLSGLSLSQLQGVKASEIPWSSVADTSPLASFPWSQAARDGEDTRGIELRLQRQDADNEQIFVVNASPILGGDGRSRGALATFDDVTAIEQKNARLERMVHELDEVRQKVQKQNEVLQLLATSDELTKCLNRRALFERMEAEWSGSERHGHALACIMLDIDHFKSINDNHGHAMGDQVLQRTAATIKESVRKRDIVGRYGGEEFCVLLPHTDLEQGESVAQKLCEAIAAEPMAGIPVTVSLGVSSVALGAETPQQLVDQADQALYAAKHGGRNQTVRFDRIEDTAVVEAEASAATPADASEAGAPGAPLTPIHPSAPPAEAALISFHAVLALMSALNHRDPSTANHCHRVADLAVAISMDLMSAGDRFVLEVAALLHDIGKIGVPDAILLKPDRLTNEEWEIMETHDRIGIEIINSAFSCPELNNIVANHHAWFAGNPRDPSLPKGQAIPLRARILTIADAYDAMVSDRVYRKGRPRKDAIRELRNCAGIQFDPELVEHAISVILAREEGRETSTLPRSTEVMLGLGLVIERLTVALDAKDFATLEALAHRVRSIAANYFWDEIEALAGELCEIAQGDNLTEIVETTRDLLHKCHAAQSQFLRLLEHSAMTRVA